MANKGSGLLTVKKVAEILGVIPRRVRAMIDAKQIAAVKYGRDWLITPSEAERVRALPRPGGWPRGRPRKQAPPAT